MPEVMFQKVEYLKLVQPPTLKQFLINKVIKEASAQIKGFRGNTRVVTTKEVDGRTVVESKLMPKSAAILKNGLSGMTADRILELHPEWKDDYAKFVDEWKAKNSKS